MNSMYPYRDCFKAIILVMGVLLAFGGGSASAQRASDSVSSRVEHLYAQAVSAQRSGETAKAIADYRAMIRIAPDVAPAYNNLGMLLFNEHKYHAAVPVLVHGLRVNPHMATSVVMLGLAYFEIGENRKAEPLLEKAVHADSSNADAQLSLAHVLLNLGKKQEAVQHLRSYLRIKPRDQQAWYLLGKTYLQMSENALGKVREINPHSFVAHEVAGEIDQSMKNYDGALLEFKKAVDLAPHDPGTHLRLANVYWLMGKWGSAETEFRSVLALAPNDCRARWKLANSILQSNSSAQKALGNLNRAIRECPNLMQARVDRARALIQLNRQSQALPDLQRAEKAIPDEPMIHFYLASVYRSEGKTKQMRKQMRVYAHLQQQSNAATANRVQEELKLKGAAH